MRLVQGTGYTRGVYPWEEDGRMCTGPVGGLKVRRTPQRNILDLPCGRQFREVHSFMVRVHKYGAEGNRFEICYTCN